MAALLHAEAILPATPSERETIRTLVAWSGERIADAIGYALSQRNNHGLSEATGLILAGSRLGREHPGAWGWLARGLRLLEREIPEQFARDGWYVQHSFNYLRLALDQCALARRCLRAVGHDLSAEALARLRLGVALLAAVTDHRTGAVPRHGADDGSWVLPLTSASRSDFRPALTHAAGALDAPLPTTLETDPETLAWLGARAVPVAAGENEGVTRGDGWVVVRVGPWFVFLWAGELQARPSHLDALHMDVRWNGQPVVVDAGTFAYNAAPPWSTGLSSARVHNGPLVDDREPGLRGPRFLWYSWPGGRVLEATWCPPGATVVAVADSGARRRVLVDRGAIRVTDSLDSRRGSALTVRWTLEAGADPGWIRVEGGAELREATAADILGWVAPLYGQRVATRYLEARRSGGEGVSIVTDITPPPAQRNHW
jgi:hypothetical protein